MEEAVGGNTLCSSILFMNTVDPLKTVKLSSATIYRDVFDVDELHSHMRVLRASSSPSPYTCGRETGSGDIHSYSPAV